MRTSGDIALTRLIKVQYIWSAWKKFGEVIGDFVARVVLTMFYFTVLVPFGIGVRLFGDPLRVTPPSDGVGWQSRDEADASLDAGRRQF